MMLPTVFIWIRSSSVLLIADHRTLPALSDDNSVSRQGRILVTRNCYRVFDKTSPVVDELLCS